MPQWQPARPGLRFVLRPSPQGESELARGSRPLLVLRGSLTHGSVSPHNQALYLWLSYNAFKYPALKEASASLAILA